MRNETSNRVILILSGILFTLLLIEISCRFFALVLTYQPSENKIFQTPKTVRILCIGESTTMLGGYNSYPSQLERILNASHRENFQVYNKGIPGTDSSVIVSQIEDNLQTYKPDFVVSMMGINDREDTPIVTSNEHRSFSDFIKNLRVLKLFLLVRQHLQNKYDEFAMRVYKNNIFTPGSSNYLIERKLRAEVLSRPKDEWIYVELAEFYESHGARSLAEEVYQKGIAHNSRKS